MFAFMNIPIAIGMLMHGTTGVAAGIFWQWVNQSMNVVQNYTNRSGKHCFSILGTFYLSKFCSVVGTSPLCHAVLIFSFLSFFCFCVGRRNH